MGGLEAEAATLGHGMGLGLDDDAAELSPAGALLLQPATAAARTMALNVTAVLTFRRGELLTAEPGRGGS